MSANIILVGHVGKDPESSAVGNTTMARFSVATTTRKKGRTGEWKEETTWWKCVCFGQQADYTAEHIHKGDLVEVSGEASTETWTDKDGKERTDAACKADRVRRLAQGGEGGASRAPAARATAGAPEARPAARPAAASAGYHDSPPF
jgi:single-strand DNA-binding protein